MNGLPPQPAAPARKERLFLCELTFANGARSKPFGVQAYNATGAAAKLTGIISDQPVRVTSWTVTEQQEGLIVAARTIPSPRG